MNGLPQMICSIGYRGQKMNLCLLDKSGVTTSAVINFPKLVVLDSNQTPNIRCSLASLVLKWLTNQSRMAGAKVS